MAALLALLVNAPAAAAKTFVVNKRADHAPNGCTKADCTLREAVLKANNRLGNDRIVLPGGKPYRLTRAAGLPGPDPKKGDLDLGNAVNEAGNAVTLVHPGAGRAIIDASAAGDRVAELTGVATLRKLVLRRGATLGSGGAIASSGVLELVNTRIVRNETGDAGGGIYADIGSVVARNTVLRRNNAWDGGGLFVGAGAGLDLRRSTVALNSADPGSGGGIWIASDAPLDSRIVASTVSGNFAASDGGALRAAAELLGIVNSTLDGNEADGRGGGIYGAPGTFAALNAVTIARNRADADDAGVDSGGGLYGDGGSDMLEVDNSLIARNRSTGGAVQECDAPAPVGIESLGGNLITTTAGGCGFFTDPEDVVDPQPRVGQLGDHGGPTRTAPLLAGSPAVDEADGHSPPARDQRGVLRTNPDIGAFER